MPAKKRVRKPVLLVAYKSYMEVLVTTPALEKQMLLMWFEKGGRSMEDYDRLQFTDPAVEVTCGALRAR